MMRTLTATTSAWASRGSGPMVAQTTNAMSAARMTAGTNTAETRSASRWMGARERCASATIWTMCANIVSLPTLSARTTREPVWFTVPPMTGSPAALVTGIDSPVTMDSSNVDRPSCTAPSTGMDSPGRTRNRSPTCTWSRVTSDSVPSVATRCAIFGVRSSRARIAPDVLSLARSSRTCPSRTSAVMTEAASK